MRRGGIRYEIVLNMTVLALFAILLTAIFIFKLLEEHLLSQEVENSKIFAEAVKRDFEFFIEKENVEANPDQRISQYINRSLLANRMNQFSVANSRGIVLAEVKRELTGSSSVSTEMLTQQMRRSIVWHDIQIDVERAKINRIFRIPTIVISQPILKENRIWGAMVLCFDAQGLTGLSSSGLKFFFVYMLMVALILAGFGIVLMSKIIVDPLIRLVGNTRKIAAGDFDTQVEIKSSNEIGELAQSFNEMSVKVKTMLNEREINLRELEATNRLLQKAQDEIVRSEKLATVGRISAGVAHEIGNPIGAIIGYAEVIKSGISAEQAADLNIRIGKEAARVDRIIRDLLDLSRPHRSTVSGVDVNDSLIRAKDLVFRQEIFQGITFSLQLFVESWSIKSDFHLLNQVWVNLFTNAAKAMGGHGTLTIRTKNGTFEEHKDTPIFAGATRFWTPGADLSPADLMLREVVLVEIEDTGPGVKETVLANIFEPFVTTGEPGEGTGLGLHIVASLLEEMSAVIGVRNKKVGGAVFSIIFPKEK